MTPLPLIGRNEPPAFVVQRIFTSEERRVVFTSSIGKDGIGSMVDGSGGVSTDTGEGVFCGGNSTATGTGIIVFVGDTAITEMVFFL